jgi:hypothetical protein
MVLGAIGFCKAAGNVGQVAWPWEFSSLLIVPTIFPAAMIGLVLLGKTCNMGRTSRGWLGFGARATQYGQPFPTYKQSSPGLEDTRSVLSFNLHLQFTQYVSDNETKTPAFGQSRLVRYRSLHYPGAEPQPVRLPGKAFCMEDYPVSLISSLHAHSSRDLSWVDFCKTCSGRRSSRSRWQSRMA